MNSTAKKFLNEFLFAAAFIAAVFVIWLVVFLSVNNDMLAPSPWSVIALTFTLLGTGETYLALLSTLLRAVIAFVCSMLVAFGISLLVGVLPSAKKTADRCVTLFRALPTMSVILVTLILFPSSFVPVIVAFLVAFPIIYSAFVREIYAEARLLDVCVSYGVTAANKTRYVLLPCVKRAVAPQVSDTLPLCIKVVIAGEALALPGYGLGKQMYVGKVNLDTAKVLAVTVLALAVCFIIQGAVALCRKIKMK